MDQEIVYGLLLMEKMLKDYFKHIHYYKKMKVIGIKNPNIFLNKKFHIKDLFKNQEI